MNKICPPNMIPTAAAFGALLLVATPVRGAVLTNGSFESPVSENTPSLPVGSTYLDGWTVVLAEIAHCVECADFGSSGGGSASDGLQSLDLTGYHDGLPYGGVRQVFATLPGKKYEVSFDVGARQGTSEVQLTVGSENNSGIWPDYQPLLTVSGAATSDSSEVVWKRASVCFVASELSTAIALSGQQASWGGIFIGLDNVVVNPVPEPVGTLAVLGIAAVAVTGLRRRQTKTLVR